MEDESLSDEAEEFKNLVEQLHIHIQNSTNPKTMTLMACKKLCDWQISNDSVSEKGK